MVKYTLYEYTSMSENEVKEWVNVEYPLWEYMVKPCKMLNYCPYGSIVELYPLPEDKTIMSCEVFGHDCPAFYNAELVYVRQPEEEVDFPAEVMDMTDEQYDDCMNELVDAITKEDKE